MRLRDLFLGLLCLLLLLDVSLHLYFWNTLKPIYALSRKPEIISERIEKSLQKDDINFPTIKLIRGPYLYYRGDVAFYNGTIYIFINNDLVDRMSNEETKAFIFHALGHFKEGHLGPKNPMDFLWSPDTENEFWKAIEREIKADAFASRYVDKQILANLIKKLAFNETEVDLRVKAILG